MCRLLNCIDIIVFNLRTQKLKFTRTKGDHNNAFLYDLKRPMLKVFITKVDET